MRATGDVPQVRRLGMPMVFNTNLADHFMYAMLTGVNITAEAERITERWRQMVQQANQRPVGTLQRAHHQMIPVKRTAFAVGLLCGRILRPFTT